MAETTEEQRALALRLIAERRYDEAVRVCRRALLGEPDHVVMRVLLGEALLANERYDETRVEMIALTKKHPDEATAHRILGEAYLRSGQTAKAKEALEQASVRGDAVASELLKEAEGEAYVESHTIERWFGQEESKTVETHLPEFTEEATPPPRRLPAVGGEAEASIQIDPDFAREASLITKEDDPSEPTMHGAPAGALEGPDLTQPLPRLPDLRSPDGLRALLAKAKPAEPSERSAQPVKKPLLVAPPSAMQGARPATSVPKPDPASIAAKAGGAKLAPTPTAQPKPAPAKPSPWLRASPSTAPVAPKPPIVRGPSAEEPGTSELDLEDLGAERSDGEITAGQLTPLDDDENDLTRPISAAMVEEAGGAPAVPRPIAPPGPISGRTVPGSIPAPPRSAPGSISAPAARPASIPPPSSPRRKQTLMGVPSPVAAPPPAAPPPGAHRGPAPPHAAPPHAAPPHAAPPHAPPPHAAPPHAPPPHAAPPHAAPPHAAPPHGSPATMPPPAHGPPATLPPPGIAPPRAAAPAPRAPRPGDPFAPDRKPTLMGAPRAPAAPAGQVVSVDAPLPQTQPEIPYPRSAAPASAAPQPMVRPVAGAPGLPRGGQPSPGQPSPGQPSPGQPSPGQPSPGQPSPIAPARPAARGTAGITGAVTTRMDEAATDPRRGSPNRSREEITGARARPDPRKLAMFGGGALIAIGLVALGASWLMDANAEEALATAVSAASDTGRPGDVQEALTLLEDDDTPAAGALRARLLATRALEMGVGDWTEADAELGTLDTAGGAMLDARVARALVSLARGHADQAATLLSGVEGTDVPLAEALHAQALALEALGLITDAREAARQAATLRPSTPRHAALSARFEVMLGDLARATATLSSVPSGDLAPPIRLGRARIALAGGDFARAMAEAEAVTTTLAESASPLDLANAHALRARAALGGRDYAGARAALDQAAALRPAWDERFALELAEGYLGAGGYDAATALVTALGSGDAADPARRARILVESALARSDLAAAEAPLAALGSSPAAELLRARVRQAQGRNDEARMLYERAAGDPTVGPEARVREGELLVTMGRPLDAYHVLQQALRDTPTDAHVVALFVEVAVATGDLPGAEAAIAPALGANPTSAPLRAARARVLMGQGHAPEAIVELRSAVQMAPADASIQTALAEAAYATNDRATARSAYEAALSLHETAALHLALATVLDDEAMFTEALSHADRAAALSAAPRDVTRLRLRTSVLRGLGQSAASEANAATDANPDDAMLWALRGALEMQAEDFDAADRSITRALRLSPTNPDALLVRVGLSIEEGGLGGATAVLDRAERSGAGGAFAARVRALRGRLRFEAGDEAGARRFAQEAIGYDVHCGTAHLLLADLADGDRTDSVPSLRAAAGATGAPPEAIGRLAVRLQSGAEACGFARAYLERAPNGYDADAVQAIVRRCR